MEEGQPSRTALRAAAHRAAHQTLEGGRIFADLFARAILGDNAEALIEQVADTLQRSMRLFIAARSRFAEDCLSAAVLRGVRQAVVLGAGLDTFSLRNPHAELGLRVFEVDHPATQAWKRQCLTQAGLATPPWVTFTPVDFERQDLSNQLKAAGFQANQPTFFLWLGVVPYLKRDAVLATLRFIAESPEAEVVFDYSEPLENYPPDRRASVAVVAERAAAIGEPWLSFFEPAVLQQELRDLGFEDLEDLAISDIAVRFFGVPLDEAKGGPGPHVIRARRLR